METHPTIEQYSEKEQSIYVVGIGASAGGLEAIEQFFKATKTNNQLAYVVIQHLSPDYKSLMPEILSKHTEMPIHTVEDGMTVEAGNIYLIPRRMNMKIQKNRLYLTEKQSHNTLNLPVDIFFSSLAEDYGDKSIAVILSGTGSDGSRGIREIKEAGGMVIAQSLESAKFDGMPRSAISTGVCDFVLKAAEIPEKIINYTQHPFVKDLEKRKQEFSDGEDFMGKIILLLYENFGLDFEHYKPATIVRRIERRLSINQLQTLREYYELLLENANEQSVLYKELLIGVTKFFRDPEAFQYLEEKVIPRIFNEKQGAEELRIWIAGCSTGEEVYSLAILFEEYRTQKNIDIAIKIFATDVDKKAVEYASYGIYNESILADITEQRVLNYFDQLGDNFKVKNHLREMVVFAKHNVFKDPPFNKIDFLSCRNLLIYFQPVLQDKTLALFHFALRKGGTLFLGSSESTSGFEDMFEQENIRWKLFRSKGEKRPMVDNIIRPKIDLSITTPKRILRKNKEFANLVNEFNTKLLKDNTPTTVIVNSDFEVVNSFGSVKNYLNLPDTDTLNDRLNTNIKEMVPANLSLTFNIAINQALKTRSNVVYNNILYSTQNSEEETVDLIFSPYSNKDYQQAYVFIYFVKSGKTRDELSHEKIPNLSEYANIRIADLENELQHTKENLQATIEELETTNEELQSTNEELISSNEELQSTNEELQSVNEELYTVNTEFQVKNHELQTVNNDLENLLSNSEIRILFLDHELRIRRFTKSITDIISLNEGDRGRSISDMAIKLRNINLGDLAKNVLDKFQTVSKTVKNIKGESYLMKIMPYRTRNNIINGVVITFFDITEQLHAEEALKENSQFLEDIFNKVQTSIFVLDKKEDEHFHFINFNRQFENFFHISKKELLHTPLHETALATTSSYLINKKIEECIETKKSITYEEKIEDHEQTRFWTISLKPIQNAQKEVIRIIGSGTEITENKNTKIQLTESKEFFDAIYNNSPLGYLMLDEKGAINRSNVAASEILGLSEKKLHHKKITDFLPNETINNFAVFLNKETPAFQTEALLKVQSSQPKYASLTFARTKIQLPNKNYIICQIEDITENKKHIEQMQWQNKFLNTFTECRKIIINAQSENKLLERISQTIASEMNYPLVWFGVKELDNEKNIKIQAVTQKLTTTFTPPKLTWDTEKNLCPTGLAISKKTSLSQNLHDIDNKEYQELERQFKLTSTCSAPIIIDKQAIAAISVFSEKNITPDEQNYLNAIATDIAEGIRNIRNIEMLHRTQEAMVFKTKQFEDIIDHIPSLVFYKDTKNNYIYVNKELASLHEKPKDELIGKNLSQVYSSKDAEKYYADDQEVIKTGKPKLHIIETVTVKNKVNWILTNKIPLKDVSGKVIGIIATADNITEQWQKEKELAEKRDFLGMASKYAKIGFWKWHLKDNSLIWSDESLNIFGISSKQFDNKVESFERFLPQDDLQELNRVIEQSIQKKENYQCKYRIKINNDTYKWINEIAHIIIENDEVTGFIGIMQELETITKN